MRAFLGIDFDPEMKKRMLLLSQELRSHAVKGRWKHSDNFHLTLKFLDEISLEEKTGIDNAMNELCLRIPPFRINTSDLGVFKGRESIRVLWLGVQGDTHVLRLLQNGIENALATLRYSPESRSYNPHITLEQDIVFREDFNSIKKKLREVPMETLQVDSLYLFMSEQSGGRRIYTRISEYKLGGTQVND